MKKFLFFFAGICMLTIAAITLSSCSNDDLTSLEGTSWKGQYTKTVFGSPVTAGCTFHFAKDTYTSTFNDEPQAYTLSDNLKKAYLTTQNGTAVGLISDDFQRMSLTYNGVPITLERD